MGPIKRIPFCFLICILTTAASKGYAQQNEPDFQINLLSEYFIKGDFSISYDSMVGGDIQYYFSHSQPWHHVVKSEYRTSTSQSDAAFELLRENLTQL